jgi:hypothetical protein
MLKSSDREERTFVLFLRKRGDMKNAARIFSRMLLSAMLISTMASAYAVEIHGINVKDSEQVGGKALILNGAGTRYFALFFKVYVAGLYLPRKTADAEEAITMAGPKMIHLVMLRNVGSSTLSKKLIEDLDNNVSPQELSKLSPSINRMNQLFKERAELKTGDVINLIYTPGQGTTIQINGSRVGAAFTDPDFFNALEKVWLGNKPAETRLKSALLGDSSESN